MDAIAEELFALWVAVPARDSNWTRVTVKARDVHVLTAVILYDYG
jgi:hypothetical protein